MQALQHWMDMQMTTPLAVFDASTVRWYLIYF